MASEVDICNKALGQLGESPIMSLNPPDDSKKARLCKQHYADIRDEVLRAYPWRCAIAYQSLNPLTGSDAITNSGYTYTYQLPADPFCLRALSVNGDTKIKWERVGNKLLTDEPSVILKFIKRIIDPGEFDTLLKDAIATRLASILAYPIISRADVGITMWELYERKLAEARAIDSMEGSTIEIISDDLLSVR